LEQSEVGERVLLVHLRTSGSSKAIGFDDEFKELAISAGANVVDSIFSRYEDPDPKYLIRKGKAQEIFEFVKANEINVVLIDHHLTPIQGRNLEKFLCCKVLDRTDLILDIFAQRARTFEGKLQVELAQLEHLATKLVRGWTHLERQKGGIGLRGGPGETQLEVDKRLIREKIKHIKHKLEKVRQQRELSRRARNKSQIPTISLVGYTNTGKSTLFNAITGANIYAADQLFATLDPTFRTVCLPYVGKVILADTVGFIRDLPHSLIDAFQATLEETKNADLLLHVIDCQDELWENRKKQVELVLAEIGALHVPVLEVYNKIDLVDYLSEGFDREHDGVIRKVRISAREKRGIDILLNAIAERLVSDVMYGCLKITTQQARERALLYDIGVVEAEKIDVDGNWLLDVRMQKQDWNKLCKKFDGLENSLIK
jgi:GTP-binding protein HflX